MAALTAPYVEDVEERITRSVQHVCRVTAYPLAGEPVELALADRASITFDEAWSPHIQSRLSLAAEDAAALLAVLDPRFRCRIRIQAGYVYGGGLEDVHDLAVLHLRKINNSLELEADSDEGLAQDAKHTRADGYPPKTGINEVVLWAASRALHPEIPEVVSEFPPRYGADKLTELELDPGADYWDLISDVAARVGVWIHVGADGRWYIKPRPVLASRTALKLHSGPGGTITSPVDHSLDRDTFNNEVALRYSWTDDARNDYEVTGTAAVPGSGLLGVERIGRLTYFEERSGPVTQAQADAAAQTVLAYRITGGNGIRLEAVAAYWLRPGHTVTVQEPGQGQDRHLVRAVTFDPVAAVMTVETRKPETV